MKTLRRLPVVACVVACGVLPMRMARGQEAAERRPDAAAPRVERRTEGRPDLFGRVTAVAADGKSITVEARGRGERGAQPETTEIKLTDATQLGYWNVEAGGAKPTVGYEAMIFLAEGSKDTAARVRFSGQSDEPRPQVVGRITAVSDDGKTLTLSSRAAAGAAPEIKLKLTDKTRATYFGVANGGAKPTVGYFVMAWLEDGSQDNAARVRFNAEPTSREVPARPDAQRRPAGDRPGAERPGAAQPNAARPAADSRAAGAQRQPPADAPAPTPQATTPFYYTRGSLEKLDGTTLLLKDPRDPSAPAQPVQTDDATAVFIAGKPAKLGDLPQGSRLRITRDTLSKKAMRVEVVEPGEVE